MIGDSRYEEALVAVVAGALCCRRQAMVVVSIATFAFGRV